MTGTPLHLESDRLLLPPLDGRHTAELAVKLG